jgi:hypothetical protein
MPKSAPPRSRRRRPRRADHVETRFIAVLNRWIALVDETRRDVERVAHKTPPAQLTRARAILDQARRDFLETREAFSTPVDLPGLTAALRGERRV